ncbi:hypothetical protein [Candidatus Chlorohelix sp.]|uniref:hypothetical protein n=1 Tax=Candidatus Chlorohelix sp. TaxID=3139201 RepID=UPI003047A1C7
MSKVQLYGRFLTSKRGKFGLSVANRNGLAKSNTALVASPTPISPDYIWRV